jgi:transportin-1
MSGGCDSPNGRSGWSANEAEWDSSLIWQICEDKPEVLDQDVPGLSQRPINVFLPRLLQVFFFSFATSTLCGTCSIMVRVIPTEIILSGYKFLAGLHLTPGELGVALAAPSQILSLYMVWPCSFSPHHMLHCGDWRWALSINSLSSCLL